ncbi:MAG: hypothetical protein HY673_15035 [Chloroflexi bacterium]|nr:hypothetical protein [Chloroflexota bacterium]
MIKEVIDAGTTNPVDQGAVLVADNNCCSRTGCGWLCGTGPTQGDAGFRGRSPAGERGGLSGLEKTWNEWKAAAAREGKLSVYTTSGGALREKLVPAVKEKLGLDVELFTGRANELLQKLETERRAGLYLSDVNIQSSVVPISNLKPGGMLEPIKPILILPEALKAESRWGGKGPIYVDKKQWMFPRISSHRLRLETYREGTLSMKAKMPG